MPYEPKYDKEIPSLIHEYTDLCKNDKWRVIKAKGVRSFAKMDINLPMWEGLSEFLRERGYKISSRTLKHWQNGRDWSNDPEGKIEYLDATQRMKSIQKLKLINGSICGDYKWQPTQLLLQEAHGMKMGGDDDWKKNIVAKIIINKDVDSTVESTA